MLERDQTSGPRRSLWRDKARTGDVGAAVVSLRGAAAFSRVGAEPWSDRTNRVCPVIGVFMRAWNEGLPQDERFILVPLVARTLHTRATPPVERKRALMAADRLVRTYTPVWLNLAGLREQARLLYALPPITELAQAFDMRTVLARVSHEANAEALGVGEAGWIKASDDCWASAWAAAYDAARLAAHDPAWISAAAASRAAAGLAACLPTQPFKAALQTSAGGLFLQMARLVDRSAI
ncbi:hypothetical protein C8D03_1552 [Bosea sp. 124]|nr:hypothetical protein C8D03_1552 [Bosea sp. 124]